MKNLMMSLGFFVLVIANCSVNAAEDRPRGSSAPAGVNNAVATFDNVLRMRSISALNNSKAAAEYELLRSSAEMAAAAENEAAEEEVDIQDGLAPMAGFAALDASRNSSLPRAPQAADAELKEETKDNK